MKDLRGDPSVIFKEALFDARRQRMMVRLVVAEGHLSQHLWISIAYKEKDWRVTRADGQNFFPTPGIGWG